MKAPANLQHLDENTLYTLALLQIPGLGAGNYFKLRQICELKDIFNLTGQQLKQIGIKPEVAQHICEPDWQAIEPIATWAQQAQHHIIIAGSPYYPDKLNHIPQAPALLYAIGDVSLLKQAQIAIVGSRNPSSTGKQTAFQFAEHLASQGYVITSGMALGVDTMAHQGALAAKGKTIAVLGTGLDVIYPARNRELFQQIAEQGLLLSEFAPDTQANPNHFPMRNRIISGLSDGILVVEAALRSGSLITARQAMEQGREVFAIPGSIHNPLSKGCHKLIRQGAKLVETAEHILEELPERPFNMGNNLTKCPDNEQKITLDSKYVQFLSHIDYAATSMDSIIERSGMETDQVCTMLVTLELEGLIQSTSGGYARLH